MRGAFTRRLSVYFTSSGTENQGQFKENLIDTAYNQSQSQTAQATHMKGNTISASFDLNFIGHSKSGHVFFPVLYTDSIRVKQIKLYLKIPYLSTSVCLSAKLM